ncbi:simple sugar transport system ATP-binding protein [Deinococcus metalli]|uniref:Simple sugar transport system ATP-binding protein n=1 Tax=Deinococcus metalli TaxID=1141878 RepID=A0A7W8KK46_9DEIO|nr:sugar ABC transporter ATP-binding protein [Deinococcus metalli]MBB5378014.1 simple sugar transport system ATP-binding protein [Deinococcus metalli]GHF53784.1 sugar ABC transporter ATP-binding protein [Deinococcus metalli]
MTQLSPPLSPSPGDPGIPLLRVQGVVKTFGGVRALRGVSFDIHAGQTYHLLGENGSGKSTLIKIIAGAQPPDSGVIEVRGVPYRALDALSALEAGIETVYQDLSLFPNLSVAENVALTAQLVSARGQLARGVSWPRLREVARAALARVRLPTTPAFLDTPVETLPIAVRQLIAIARGIVSRASLVIMDEPTAALTQREVENLLGIIASLQREGVSVLFVSHKLDEVFRIGGQVIVLRDGQKVASGPLTDFTPHSVAFQMTGKTLEETRYRTAAPGTEALLEVRGLSRAGAFRDVSFTLHRGEVLGITGLLDSGRNELAHALSGVRPADSGTVVLGGETVRLRTPRDGIRLGIGYVPEDRLAEGLFLDKPIRENIMVSVLKRLTEGVRLNYARATADTTALSKDLQVATPHVMLPVGALSGGNQQKVMVARWLAIGPKVLILHGPTAGVDVGSKDALYRIVQELAAQGLGVLLISDDLPELLMNADRIGVMQRGQLTHTAPVDGLSEAALTAELLEATSPTRASQVGSTA